MTASDVNRPGLHCYDDARARTFEPFALTRPWSEMRVGALLLRERWEFVSGHAAIGFLAGHDMREFTEPGAPVRASELLPAGTLLVNSRCAIALSARLADDVVFYCDGRVAAVRLSTDMPASDFANGTRTLDEVARAQQNRAPGVVVDGVWCDEVWDLVRHLPSLLPSDLLTLVRASDRVGLDVAAAGATVLGDHPVLVEDGARLEPLTVLDATAGPILVRAGAHVQAFSRLNGPCYIGEGSTVVSGRISGCAIGNVCKVHGELSSSSFVGHSNKGHEGFVGHSVLGRWVNLGAGTTTSNLKNTYGDVALWTPDGVRRTGLQFLGTLFGDHVKTGIGLRLTTGCVLGAGANVVDRMPPKVVAPFAWGSGAPYSVYAGDKFLMNAERVMSRRAVELSAGMRTHLAEAHARRWSTE